MRTETQNQHLLCRIPKEAPKRGKMMDEHRGEANKYYNLGEEAENRDKEQRLNKKIMTGLCATTKEREQITSVHNVTTARRRRRRRTMTMMRRGGLGADASANGKWRRRRGEAVHSCRKGKSHSLPIASSQACNKITVSAPPYKI